MDTHLWAARYLGTLLLPLSLVACSGEDVGRTPDATSGAVGAADSTGARPTDVDEIADRVEDALAADAALGSFDLNVDAENGRLILEGTVSSASQQSSAEELARRVAGSVAIVNRIRVQ